MPDTSVRQNTFNPVMFHNSSLPNWVYRFAEDATQISSFGKSFAPAQHSCISWCLKASHADIRTLRGVWGWQTERIGGFCARAKVHCASSQLLKIVDKLTPHPFHNQPSCAPTQSPKMFRLVRERQGHCFNVTLVYLRSSGQLHHNMTMSDIQACIAFINSLGIYASCHWLLTDV